ncbi:MAG: Rha family transcriptional regulator [Ruminococcus sp.]|nr:Rha family transcriptional regulator [Ruminococcus sp.]
MEENSLRVITHLEEGKTVEVLDSRNVAEAVGKTHAKLMRDIRTYEEYLNEAKIGSVEFFIESEYTDNKGETRPCYLITKKGCEMIANKMTGKKGVVFTAQYVNAFHDMEDMLQHDYPLDEIMERLDILKDNVKRLIDVYNTQNTRIEILERKALPNKFVPPTADEVENYCNYLGEYIDAERFVDYYQSIGWLVGNKPMKDWKATVRNWIRSQRY